MDFSFTLWNVEHGLSIWIQTPSGQNHCIDVGHNNNTDFCPFAHMKKKYNVNSIDYLIISHPDEDHIEGLPNFIKNLGEPKCLTRNKTLPDEMKYGSCEKEYQQTLKTLDSRYTVNVPDDISPLNKKNNGDVDIYITQNDYIQNMKCNDTSEFVIYRYKKYSFICPGDLEPTGWDMLKNKPNIYNIIKDSDVILVAPHHGRPSAYSQDMINFLKPKLILVSDEYGGHETDSRYYTCASGFPYENATKKFVSTKTNLKIKISITENGVATLSIVPLSHSSPS